MMSRLLPSHLRNSRYPALLALAVAAALLAPAVRTRALHAQAAPDTIAADAAIQRARRLATDGDLAAARLLLDSLARAQDPGGPRLAEVLFWRATYAQAAADAERDYRRLVVEHPSSARSEDALLRLAQLELARGDQQTALRHLDRLVQEHPGSPNRARARYWMGRALLEAGDVAKACGALGDALAYAATTDVELRNQVRYSGQRCPRGWDAPRSAVTAAAPDAAAATTAARESTTVVARADSAADAAGAAGSAAAASGGPPPNTNLATPPRDSVTTPAPVASPTRADSAGRGAPPNTNVAQGRPAPITTPTPAASPTRVDSAPRGGPPPNTNVPLSSSAPITTPARPASAARTIYAVQLAAYGTRAEAEALVRRLRGRGVEARVSGDAKPYRVRVGRYATRAEAARQLAALKAKGHAGFVAEEPAP